MTIARILVDQQIAGMPLQKISGVKLIEGLVVIREGELFVRGIRLRVYETQLGRRLIDPRDQALVAAL